MAQLCQKKMKIEIFYARKLYNSRVSVQSSVVDYARRLGRKLIVDYEGQRMLVHNLEAYECDGQSFLARHTDKYIKAGNTYKLYDYIWDPVKQKEEEPEISLNGRMMMLKAWKEMQANKKGKQLTLGGSESSPPFTT